MNINCVLRYGGMRKRKSKKGTDFAECFMYALDANGNVDVEQLKVYSFNEVAIAKLEVLKPGTDIICTVSVNDAFLQDVEVIGDEE